jgi:hypothetical protein
MEQGVVHMVALLVVGMVVETPEIMHLDLVVELQI